MTFISLKSFEELPKKGDKLPVSRELLLTNPRMARDLLCELRSTQTGPKMMSILKAADPGDFPPLNVFFGLTTRMQNTREKLERIAKTSVPVLLQGESGTGKDILARLIHTQSNRSRSSLVKVTCPAVPQALIESELFGYEKGAFTGAYATKRGRVELAHTGSLFLDEIGSLEIASQAKLLHLVQDGTFMRVGAEDSKRVDTRLICAANGDLRQQIEDGSFRPDFYFRISAVTIELPPLRDRTIDLPHLTQYFLDRYSRDYQVEPKPLSREITNLMERYHWPGNIRQLENLLRSYVLIGDEEALISELLPTKSGEIDSDIDLASPISLKILTKAATRDLERRIILKVLQANGWSRRRTARWLNISYRSLLYKLQDSDICGLKSTNQRTQLSRVVPDPVAFSAQQTGD